jgi:GntR family transcriptional regulator/MocR family aminotransferase
LADLLGPFVMFMTPSFVTLAGITLDRQGVLPLHRQLCEALRQAILTGQFKPGLRLPSTRALTQDLGISRNTIVYAY